MATATPLHDARQESERKRGYRDFTLAAAHDYEKGYVDGCQDMLGCLIETDTENMLRRALDLITETRNLINESAR